MNGGGRRDEVWCRFELGWSLQNFDPRMPPADQILGIERAFAIWQESTKFKFHRLPDGRPAEIEIKWVNKPGEDRGEATFPGKDCEEPPEASNFWLNSAFRWTLEHRPDDQGDSDLITLAAHEIGHTLGLPQGTIGPALMWSYEGSHRFLAEIDQAWYRYLYEGGDPPPTR